MVVLICLAIPVCHFALYLLLSGPRPTTHEVIAHRGGPAHAPENTMAAFRTAVADGADWLEMDVQRSRDRALVVFHDATIDRVTNGTGRVADLTLREIVGLKVGGRERVPTFAEVVAFATQAGVRILPEAKNPELYPGIEVEIVRMLRDAGYLGKAVVQSFNHAVLENLRRVDPDVQVCPLYRLWHLSLTRPRPEGARYVCPMAEMVIVNPWMIKQAHDRGQKVFVWFGVIESPLTMRPLLALGADGLIVDDPRALAGIVKHRAPR